MWGCLVTGGSPAAIEVYHYRSIIEVSYGRRVDKDYRKGM